MKKCEEFHLLWNFVGKTVGNEMSKTLQGVQVNFFVHLTNDIKEKSDPSCI